MTDVQAFTPETFTALWLSDASIKEISETLNIGFKRIARHRSELGLRPRGVDPRDSPWTEEKITKLKELWPNHHASELAVMFGVSRSAVCGKIMRLGLSNMVKNVPSMRAPRQRSKKKTAFQKIMAAPRARVVPAPVEEFKCIGVAFADLDRTHCRWPHMEVNDVPISYCGHPQEYSSYCAHHARLAFRRN